MPMLKRDPELHAIVHKLRPHNILHRGPVLYPTHQRREHIVRAFERYAIGRSAAALAQDPRSGTRVTVEHARNAEEAEEAI